MARYKLIGNELVIVNNTNRNEIMPNTYKIAKNRENLSSQINQKKAADLKYFEMQKIKNSSYYKNEYNNQLSKRKSLQNDIQKSTYEKGVQTTVTPFSTQRNILPTQEQSEITKNKRFEVTAGQDKLAQNKNIENKYQEIKKSSEYKNQMKQLEDQSNKVGYAKYNYDKQRVEEEKINGYDKSIGRLNAGFKSIFDYSGGLIKNENGDLEYLPTFNQLKHQKVMESYDTGLGRFAGTTLYEGGKIAGATLINAALPKVGSTMYFGKMFVDSTNQAVSDGYDTGSATIYGLVNVGLEYGVGKALGSATKGLTGGRTNEYKQLLEKTFTNITKKPKLANILANAGSEATEEFIQEYLDNFNKLITLEKSTNAKDYVSVLFDSDVLSDALYSAAVGSVTGGVIGTITGKDTNVDNKEINLYKVYKEELEETKKNTTNKDTIDKIDKVISNIDSTINNDLGVNTKIAPIISQINEYETLKGQNRLTSEQEIELNRLKNQLNAIQNQNYDTSTIENNNINLPTVEDIVNQEKETKNSVNLPVYNEQSNINNSDKSILPTVSDFNSSNTNMPTSNLKIDMTKIKPEILEDIKGFILGDPSIEGYKGSYIKTMLNEVGIRAPAAMNYVSEVRSDMSFTTTKNLTRQQYASIGNALQKLRSVDVTGINNINEVTSSNNILPIDISQIKQVKGNIPINQELLNKYPNVKEIFKNEKNNYDGNIDISNNLNELNNLNIEKMTNTEIYHKAVEIFSNHHNTNIFVNNGNRIIVSNSDIKESIHKINNNSLQKKYLKEHLLVFSDLGDIIEKSSLVNQTLENKDRKGNKVWSYYLNGLKINGNNYLFEFDVISKENGENHYRVQRLEKKQTLPSESVINGTASDLATSAFSSSNIPQSNNNVNSDTSSTTKYSIPINKNNAQELENSSFLLKNSEGNDIDITNLKENDSMLRMHYKRVYDKNTVKAYRGVSENTGSNGAFYGLGLYTTLDKNYAKKYGEVFEVDNDLLPNNPLMFKTQNDFQIWEQQLAQELNIRKNKLYSNNYGVEQYIKRLGYDGLMIGSGKDTDLISFKDVSKKYSQNTKEWNDYPKDTFPSSGTKTKMSDIKLPVRDDISKNIELDHVPQDPTKESTYDEPEQLAKILKEKPATIEEKDSWLKKLATIKFVDKGYYVDKLARKVKNKELSSKYDYSLLANGIANQIIGNGRLDEDGNKVGKGLYEIFEPIENSGLLDDFSKYIYHKHNVDRMNLESRFNEPNKAVFGDSMTSEMSKKIIKEFESKYPEFEAWADEIYDYNNSNLKMLVKYGVLSKDSMEYYNNKYPHYVPVIREQAKTRAQMDFLLGKRARVNTPIKKAKGGNENIIPLKEAMALRTMQTVNSSLRNNFGLELLNSIETEQIRNKESVDNIVEEINSDELLTKSSKNSPATLTVFDKGEKITFEISDEIYEALKPSNIYTVKWLNKLNNIRRGLLTEYNPLFMITNPLKDIQDGTINSKHPELFAKNLSEAIMQIRNNGLYKQLYIANGGSYETYFNYNTGTNIAPSILDKILPLKKISEMNEIIEMAPRLAEFMASIEAGDSIETAMYNASEITTNFKRGGDITKTLDRNGVTFLNAGVQGTTKQVRNVQEARAEGIKGITKLAVRWTIAGLTPALLMGMLWADDDDYEELSDYVKNNYYIIGKYGDGKFIRIPKGRVVSVLQKFFQNIIDKNNGKEMDIDGFIELLKNNVLPSDPSESNLLSPMIQAINNETWYGGDLVPTRLQNLPNAEQYDETTDSISIWLGKKLNISPYKINYVLDQYAGAIGDYTLPYLTQEAESGSDNFAGKLLAPVKDKFTVDSTLKNQNISDFYSLSEELTKKSNSSNATDEDKLKNKYVNSVKSEISKLYAKKREIQSSSLKDSDKYNQTKEIQKQINELSKSAINDYKDVISYENYGKVSDQEYYLNSKSEWTKVKDDEKEEINKLNMSDTDKNNYFKAKVKIGVIRGDEDKESDVKHKEIANLVIDSGLNDKFKGYLYGKYYSSEKIIDTVLNAKINIDEFIKFNSEKFESDYYTNGKTVPNSRKNKVIKYINNLNLTIPQKAMLIKMEYNSFKQYDDQIVKYVNSINTSSYDKKVMLKTVGFTAYDKELINIINSKDISVEEKTKELKELGFKVRNGRVYAK